MNPLKSKQGTEEKNWLQKAVWFYFFPVVYWKHLQKKNEIVSETIKLDNSIVKDQVWPFSLVMLNCLTMISGRIHREMFVLSERQAVLNDGQPIVIGGSFLVNLLVGDDSALHRRPGRVGLHVLVALAHTELWCQVRWYYGRRGGFRAKLHVGTLAAWQVQ